jgi:hypothetical protein
MDLTFIDNAMVQDAEYRKLIRKQCMKGKNVGKMRPKRVVSVDTSTIQLKLLRPKINASTIGPIKSVYSDRFGSFYLPFTMDTRMHRLLHQCESLIFA